MQTELQTFTFQVDWQHRDGAPNYRYFKLAFTAALRLRIAIEIKSPLNIQAHGPATSDPRYKDRQTYEGRLSLNGQSYDNVLFVVDHRGREPELVTFWRMGQPGERAGSKGGAHPFAELYVGYLRGQTTEAKVFDTAAVATLCDRYNVDRDLNVQAWIVNNLPADGSEPPISQSPIEEPLLEEDRSEYPPELHLLNKWRSDVLQTGLPYTNYEVDACVRNVGWNPSNGRISFDLHWEEGKYVPVFDFGRNDRYANDEKRKRVLGYLKKYDGTNARARLILTVKGTSTDWTLASATMLKRLPID